MEPQSKPRSELTWEQKLFRKFERQTEAGKAYAEYQANQDAKLQNMRRLRELRLSKSTTVTAAKA